jgi:hypothetical protein
MGPENMHPQSAVFAFDASRSFTRIGPFGVNVKEECIFVPWDFI